MAQSLVKEVQARREIPDNPLRGDLLETRQLLARHTGTHAYLQHGQEKLKARIERANAEVRDSYLRDSDIGRFHQQNYQNKDKAQPK
jgi:hypothetical protein